MNIKQERVLVIGYGSIGKRHALLLNNMQLETAVLTQQVIDNFVCYHSLSEAMDDFSPAYVVVANETWRHAQTVRDLISHGFQGRLLVEKPLFSKLEEWPKERFAVSGVAYNLRFHPLIQRAKKYLQVEEPVSVSIRCGQHLSEWRPERSIQDSYSSSFQAGGGVLRDLSHELDYLLWIFGAWSHVTALGGNYNVLGIDADEIWSVLLEMQSGISVTLNISYLDIPAQREIVVTTRSGTLSVDLVNGILSVNGKEEKYNSQRDETYIAMHHAMLSESSHNICSIRDGVEVLKLIKCIEEASESRSWVSL